MKTIIPLLSTFFAAFIFLSCHKENGKHKYLLTLDFDYYDDNATFEYYVFEKVKNYKQSYAPSVEELRYNEESIYLANKNLQTLKLDLEEGNIKKRGVFISDNYFEMNDYEFPVNSIPANPSNRFYGRLNVSLGFTKEGREIIAKNTNSSYCIFTFIWQNAAEFGHTDSIFHGTCSLLRVE